MRAGAVWRLTDQVLLASIAKTDTDYPVRLAAVEKLADQAVLAAVAKADTSEEVRQSAVVKLTDQAVLAAVAKNDASEFAREAAVVKLTDQAVLAVVAKADGDPGVRRAAFVKLMYLGALASIAETVKTSGPLAVRKAALGTLTDQVVLGAIAMTDADWRVRRAAVNRLTDQAIVAAVASANSSEIVRFVAVRKLHYQPFLAAITRTETSTLVRAAAVVNITDRVLLGGVSKTDGSPLVRLAAVIGLGDRDALLGFAATESPREPLTAMVAVAVAQKLQGQEPILRVPRTFGESLVSLAAASYKTPDAWFVRTTSSGTASGAHMLMSFGEPSDQSELSLIARAGGSPVVRLLAVEKLADEAALTHFASSDSDPDVRAAAQERLERGQELGTAASDARRESQPARAASTLPFFAELPVVIKLGPGGSFRGATIERVLAEEVRAGSRDVRGVLMDPQTRKPAAGESLRLVPYCAAVRAANLVEKEPSCERTFSVEAATLEREARTGLDGAFFFEGLPYGRYAVFPRRATESGTPPHLAPAQNENGAMLVFIVEEGASTNLTVVWLKK